MANISLSGFIRNSTYWSKQTGVRWALVLSIVGFWLLTMWLREEYGQDDSTLWLVMRQFTKLLQWTLIGLLTLSILSALATWGYFAQMVRTKKISVQIKFGDGQKAEAGWVPISVQLTGQIFRPFFGVIQARLIFSGKRFSEPILLDGNVAKPRHLWRFAIKGSGQTLLHDRGIYDVEYVLVSFGDMLALVSLPTKVHLSQQLYTLPRPQAPQRIAAQPNSTEEQKHRIDIPKRVEGEHVNYKEFESGDNIQRIVWKIYAKSGQLVVRIPEIKDPYASHLYFYVSYFQGSNKKEGSFENELLNVYKDKVRNFFEALQHNGYDVRMPADQEVPKLAGLSEKKNELFQITAASWQNGIAPSTFVNPAKAAFVCLPSFVTAAEVEIVMKKLSPSVPLVVVKLSEAIPSPFRFQLKDILFRPEPHPSDSLKQPWLISSLRRELQRNEKEITAILKQRENSWLTDTLLFE